MVEDAVKKNEFPGEHETLSKYGTLNALAEALYRDNTLNIKAANEFNSIHHLKQNINFYLSELLKNICADQIYAVLTAEYLDEDIQKHLSVQAVKRVHENSSSIDTKNLYLSKVARENLRKFLNDDYLAIKKSLTLVSIPENRRLAVLN